MTLQFRLSEKEREIAIQLLTDANSKVVEAIETMKEARDTLKLYAIHFDEAALKEVKKNVRTLADIPWEMSIFREKMRAHENRIIKGAECMPPEN